jgi:hypothetical protein
VTSGGDPWADPATPTQPGSPYAGPPVTAPYGMPTPYGMPNPYGTAGPYGYAPGAYPVPYGMPMPWRPMPPARPALPGAVVTAAVLAFVQAGVVLIASLYLSFFASVLSSAQGSAAFPPSRVHALATEGKVLALVQVVSALVLIAAGIRALKARTRATWVLVVGALAVQVLLAAYWLVRLAVLLDASSGSGGQGAFLAVTLFFVAAPMVALGLLLFGAGRRWFDGAQPA